MEILKWKKKIRVVRVLNIIVQKVQWNNEDFQEAVGIALKEYAAAASKKEFGNHNNETFISTNGCEVRVIAGRYDLNKNGERA